MTFDRLLVRGVNWLGDAVMSTPALRRLREANPRGHLAVLTPAKLADLYAGHPAVNEVLPFQPGDSPWVIGRRLRSGRYTEALVLPNSPRSALECLFAGVPRRIGVGRGIRRWLLTDPVSPRPESVPMRRPSRREIEDRLAGRCPPFRPPPAAHQSLEYLHLAAALGASWEPVAPSLVVSDGEVAAVRARFGLESEVPWLGLNAGAEYGPAKRWPADRFAATAQWVHSRTGARWVLFGGRNDAAVAGGIADQVPGSVNLAGRTTLRELMAALSVCALLLTNDTGPMHVAAALGLPVVVPFGSTSPELTGPGRPGDPRHRLIRQEVACAPCFLRECPIDFRCLLGITPERVAEEVVATWEDVRR